MTTPRSRTTAHVDHGMRRQAIVQSVLGDVFQGRLRTGQHLVTQALADRFGVSHTPIREALITLAGIGIIDLVPNCGAVVRAVTARDIREICQVRRVLECEATRRACGQIDLNDLNSLAEDLRKLIARPANSIAGFITEARKLDTRLHEMIAGSCGNAFLAKELGRLKILFRSFRDLSYTYHEAHNDFRRFADEAGEHLAVVEALLAGDAREASRAMARHIRTGVRYWTRAMPACAGGANGTPANS
jgi:DNA-binding GntR family transcriptional regulator